MVEEVQSGGKEIGKKRDWRVFLASVFFVLGFAVVFSVLGVLLQSVLSNSALGVQKWLSRIGGVVIILFGLFILGLLGSITPGFLKRDRKIKVRTFKSMYLTSFLFGAAFAVGWTPCVTVALGAILVLALTQPSSAFFLLFAYTLGLGLPFLLMGLFINQAQDFIQSPKTKKWMKYVNYIFGAILVFFGMLVFTNELGRIANFELLTEILINLDFVSSAGSGIASVSFVTLGIAFLGGLASFLSPCVMPLIPGFLSYLGAVGTTEKK